MRDINDIKKVGAKVYYRDRLQKGGDEHGYTKGTVVEYKSVTNAEMDWGQQWSRRQGTIVKIRNDEDPEVYRYRHTSAVITPEQYREKYAREAGALQKAYSV